MKNLLSRNNSISFISILLILAVWEGLSRLLDSGALLPGLIDTAKVFFNLIQTTSFWLSVSYTLLRGVLGFILAGVASLLIGIPCGLKSGIEAFFSPILVIIRSTPVVSIILLALIWLKVENVPVFIGFLTMFPILTTNISQGIRSVDKGYIQMAKVYEINWRHVLTGIYLPGISSYVYSALLTAVGFGWRAIIIGEVLSQPRFGIGSQMQKAQVYLLVAEVISWTLIAVSIGFLFEKLIRFAKTRMIKWENYD